MNIVYKDIDELTAYELNAKVHDEKQVEQIANSIKEFGFVQPAVIDKHGVIVIGHGRIEALKLLGRKEVPCVCVDELTDEQVKALRLADNKTNESEWDDDLLAVDLGSIGLDMSQFGFEIDFDINFGAGTIDEQGDLTKREVKTKVCPNCGEIIEL